jgi:hypothetical protein
MEYIGKRAAARVTAFRQLETADWWQELSPEGQAEYLKEHPDSKKAKEIHEQRKQAQLKRPSIKTHEDHLEKQEHPDMVKHADDHPKNIEHLHPDAQKFFKEGQDKPGSPERKAAGSAIKKMASKIMQATKKAAAHNVKEWKHGVKGIAKAIHGKKLSDHEKEGVKAIIKDVLVTAGIVAVGGGLAHGVLAAMAHVGRDLLAETMFKTIAHGIIEHGTEVASTENVSAAAIAFTALVHEVLADADLEEAAGKLPLKKGKKNDKKTKKSEKDDSKSKSKKLDDREKEDEENSDSDDNGGTSEDEDSELSSESDDVPSNGTEEDDKADDHDPETQEAITQVISFLAKFAEQGKIPKEAWLAAASEEPMEDGKIFPDGEPSKEEDEDELESEEDGVNEIDEDAEDDDGPEGDGATIEDKVKQKNPDDPPKNPKLKNKDKTEDEEGDEDDNTSEDDDSEIDETPSKKVDKSKKFPPKKDKE